mmetsp:Transcript_8878/g.39296  ORF Transcript_8878/g.39296 Transcript_8878/m.39296 type:complete len:206 (+) Transcript_8878:2826-3443(+)
MSKLLTTQMLGKLFELSVFSVPNPSTPTRSYSLETILSFRTSAAHRRQEDSRPFPSSSTEVAMDSRKSTRRMISSGRKKDSDPSLVCDPCVDASFLFVEWNKLCRVSSSLSSSISSHSSRSKSKSKPPPPAIIQKPSYGQHYFSEPMGQTLAQQAISASHNNTRQPSRTTGTTFHPVQRTAAAILQWSGLAIFLVFVRSLLPRLR